MRRGAFPFLAAALLAALAGPWIAAQTKEEPKKAPPPARVKVIKVWAFDAPQKVEKSKGAEGAKDELKDYRKLLEEKTGKKHFAIEGKAEIQDAFPGRALVYPLLEDCKLEITPILDGKGKEEKLALLLSLKKGKVEKRGPYKFCGTLPLIYKLPNMLPIHQEGRNLVAIVQKLPTSQEPASEPSK